jgi:N-acetylated-alpha-linked acidic dipeptidase
LAVLQLAAAGVSIVDRIVIVKAGLAYRGSQVDTVARHGGRAVIVYGDPQDFGADRGPVYPDGPFRPMTGERASN